jgi:uncharacterized protein YjiS (DUF1127 family)
MTAPFAKEQLELLSSTNPIYGSFADSTGRVQARGAGPFRRMADAARWVVTWPRRQAVLEELARLSDRELTDIGLDRGDLRSIFAHNR